MEAFRNIGVAIKASNLDERSAKEHAFPIYTKNRSNNDKASGRTECDQSILAMAKVL